ncbi:MAG: hypothetical protein OXP70_13920 [Acidobacteriota bacterium]|nr:hypothetical protein [Acidobacteriota bacterium]
MTRPILIGALALTCPYSADAQDWRKIGGEPDPLGRVEPVRFVKDATVIEPAESDLSIVMIVFCGDESSEKATVAVRLAGASPQGASGAARIDDGETIDIFWFAGRGSSFMELMSGDMSVNSFGEEWQEELKAILTAGSEAILSFEPVGQAKHFFRLNLAGLATRIEMCESAVSFNEDSGSRPTPDEDSGNQPVAR